MRNFNYKRHEQKDNWVSVQFYYTVNLFTLLPFYHPDFNHTYFVHCDNTRIFKKMYGDAVYDIILKRDIA